MPTCERSLANGLPRVSRLIGDGAHGGTVTSRFVLGPDDDVRVGRSPKIPRSGAGGLAKSSFGGFGCGGVVMLLPAACANVNGFTWLARVALPLRCSSLNTRSSGQPTWIS